MPLHVSSIYAHHQEVRAVLSQPVHQTATYRCDDIRGCVMQFDLLMMSICARNM